MISCPDYGPLEEGRLGVVDDDPRQQLEELDLEIARLEALLEQLKGKRVPLKRQINRLYAPVLRLPPELSSQIFLSYLPTGRCEPQKELALTPLAFGRVCSDWRNQAWSMPWLWNQIRFDLRGRCTPTVSVLLGEWLTLSRDFPLSIYLVFDAQDASRLPSVHDPNVTAIIALIASFCERWHSIMFALPLPLFRGFRCVQGRLPLLASVDLYITDDPHVVGDAFQPFSIAPRLQKACVLFDWDGPILPTTQLTHLSARPRDFGLCLDILRSSPCLVNADFSMVHPSDVTMLTPVTAPQLKSFELSMRSGPPSLSSGLLDALTLPSLCKLHLHADAANVSVHASLISLIDRSSCSLTHLNLSSFFIQADHIIECFRATPSVVDLRLTWINGVKPNDIIRMLDPFRISEFGCTHILLPNLRRLSVTGEYFDWSDVTKMLAHRWSSPAGNLTSDGSPFAQLRHFSVGSEREGNLIGEHAAIVIKGLEADGMDIWINPFLFRETYWLMESRSAQSA